MHDVERVVTLLHLVRNRDGLEAALEFAGVMIITAGILFRAACKIIGAR
jgi:hypothetical protein